MRGRRLSKRKKPGHTREKETSKVTPLDEAQDFFEQNPQLTLNDLDLDLLRKVIIYGLGSMIFDPDGNPPNFTISNNHVFMEIEGLRFTIDLRDNNAYQ